MRTRLIRRLAPLLLLAVVAVGAAYGASSAAFTIKTAKNSALGSIVVNSTGQTLYHLTSETKGSVKCTGACAAAWPPLTIAGSAKPTGGPGITTSKLGTLKRPDGKVQVTYNGLALYRYSEDTKAGTANGQGEGRVWYAITPAGKITKVSASASSSTSAGSTASGNSGGSSSAYASASGGGGAAAECPAGQNIPQGYGGDGDDDNAGGQTDGDGCL